MRQLLALGAAAALLLMPMTAHPQPTPVAAAEAGPAKLPAAVDLRPTFRKLGLDTRRQGKRGTCSVFAVTGALEFAHAAREGKGTALSVEFLNWAAHQATGRKADGGFFSEIWQGYAKYGICPEAVLPYRPDFDARLRPETAAVEQARSTRRPELGLHWIKEWNVRTGLTDQQLAEIRGTLAKGWPVCGGFRWPKQEHWDEGVLRMCPPEAVFDGHSVLLVGYRDDPGQPGGGVFLIRNSSGPAIDGALPYLYVRTYMNDAAWIGPTDPGAKP